jgi:hypothetical protein
MVIVLENGIWWIVYLFLTAIFSYVFVKRDDHNLTMAQLGEGL